MISVKNSKGSLDHISANGLQTIYKVSDKIIQDCENSSNHIKAPGIPPSLIIQNDKKRETIDSALHDTSSSSSATLADSEGIIRFSGSTSPVIASKSARFSLSIPNNPTSLKINAAVNRRYTIHNKNPKNMHICISMNAAKELKYKELLNGNISPSTDIEGLEDSNGNIVLNLPDLVTKNNIALYFSDCVGHEISKSTKLIIDQSLNKLDNTIYIYIPIHQTYKNMREMLKKTNFYSIPSYKTETIDYLTQRYNVDIFPTLVVLPKNDSPIISCNGIDQVFNHISTKKSTLKQSFRNSTWLNFMKWK
ncbi:hypothetical protein BB561_004735 [Smittium simulii]|uniref:Thioredoxin-like fold domain-containing protein n=1 Tax=Smittium simulii TaxID=133385 RepID=A0A2T9YEN3_9FUNG|nr:hypothetical protein BB561_004736 [Smittium simulii]PVU90744.1 hypothetical protein BB561_004735 [Smittium simulii]